MNYRPYRHGVWVLALSFTAAGCMLIGEQDANVLGDKAPLIYAKRAFATITDPTTTIKFGAGGDLVMKSIATPSAPEKNITSAITQGAGDVQGPEINYAGTKVIFSMRCSVRSAPQCANDNTWNIWEYTLAGGELRRVIRSSETANAGDDLDPAYLPDGRIIFTSNRQQGTQTRLGYRYVDGERKEYTFNLHVMEPDGSGIEQISFGLSHDRFPTVLSDGRVLFSRWDRSAQRSKFSLYKIRPDGRELTPYYGAHSPGGAFFQPRELQDGRLIANVLPLAGSYGGGALMYIDARRFGDVTDPPGAAGEAQTEATLNHVSLEDAFFTEGRYAAPYPIADGSARVLVSFAGPPAQSNDKPRFGIYELDLTHKNLLELATEPTRYDRDGKLIDPLWVYTEPVAVLAMPTPPVLPRAAPKSTAMPASDGSIVYGTINIKSVYDVDSIGYVGSGPLTDNEKALITLPTVAVPGDPARGAVVDIAKLRDPMQTKSTQRPARFLRVVGAVPMPLELPPNVIGLTPMGAKKIYGYVPIEPDGSVRVRVPADTPIAVTVLDESGRAFADHDDWFQVRPGEELVCNGCHSYKRTLPINTGAPAREFANTRLRNERGLFLLDPVTQQVPALALLHETMAEMRTRVDNMAGNLMPDLHYIDVWTYGRIADTEVHLEYSALPVGVPAPLNGIVDYQQHVQTIWDVKRPVLYKQGGYRGENWSCSEICHNGTPEPTVNPTGLDLRKASVAGAGRSASYESLLKGAIAFDPATNMPYYTRVDGRVKLQRAESLVMAGHARGSYLIEILSGEELHAMRPLAAKPYVDHAAMLSPSEKLVIAEWVDIGAQYYNDIIGTDGKPVKAVNPLLTSAFNLSGARGVLYNRCGQCHMLFVRGVENRLIAKSEFILTDNFDEDYMAASLMVDDLANPANSKLLARPTSLLNHPTQMNGTQIVPILNLNDPYDKRDYDQLMSWILLSAR
ncbi:MAG: hypothetical protein AABY83_14725 [Pseudomonadota bacterium]